MKIDDKELEIIEKNKRKRDVKIKKKLHKIDNKKEHV